jgi:hypothetical protein
VRWSHRRWLRVSGLTIHDQFHDAPRRPGVVSLDDTTQKGGINAFEREEDLTRDPNQDQLCALRKRSGSPWSCSDCCLKQFGRIHEQLAQQGEVAASIGGRWMKRLGHARSVPATSHDHRRGELLRGRRTLQCMQPSRDQQPVQPDLLLLGEAPDLDSDARQPEVRYEHRLLLRPHQHVALGVPFRQTPAAFRDARRSPR